MLDSGLECKCKCGGCNTTYYGKTKCHFKIRIYKYLGIWYITGKTAKIDDKKLTAIQEQLLSCKYHPSFEDFSILTLKVMILHLK